MLVVGSKALNYRFPSLNRNVKDVDVIAFMNEIDKLQLELLPERIISSKSIVTFFGIQNKNEIFDKNNVEFLVADNSAALRKYLTFQKIKCNDELFACPEILFSLKKSHIHFPIKFNKHIHDYVYLNNYFSQKDILEDITKSNFKETEQRVGKLKTPSLNKSVDKFFDQSKSYVKSYFVHDDIHKAVAHYDEPLFLNMQEDRTKAKCEKSLWELFSFEDKCKCVLEEAYVIALERKVLPSIYGGNTWCSAAEAVDWSLMRICTTLCSGWFRKFATDNYFEIKKLIDKDYVLKFLQKVDNGEIIKIEGD